MVRECCPRGETKEVVRTNLGHHNILVEYYPWLRAWGSGLLPQFHISSEQFVLSDV